MLATIVATLVTAVLLHTMYRALMGVQNTKTGSVARQIYAVSVVFVFFSMIIFARLVLLHFRVIP